jgi:tetratricopeptide (TPR) repeat protein
MAEAEAILLALGPEYYALEEGLRVKGFFASQRARIALHQGEYETAKQYSAECIRLYEASGSRWFAGFGHTNIGVACVRLGQYPQAREHFLAASDRIREYTGSTPDYLSFWLAVVDVHLGNLTRALETSRASILQALERPNYNLIAVNLELRAVICAKQGQASQAARLAGASAEMNSRHNLKRGKGGNIAPDTLPGWREVLDRAVMDEAYEAGQAMSTDEAVAMALADDADPGPPSEQADEPPTP